MSMPIRPLGGPGAAAAPATGDAALRDACAQVEGVFYEQVLKALRATIPEGGAIDGGAGEEIFSGLLDGHLSSVAAVRMQGSLGDALYRQLRGALDASGGGTDAPVPADSGRGGAS